MVEKYNDVLTRQYKNTEIEVVIEDDAITMGRIYLDGRCIDVGEFYTDKGEDVPFTRTNFDNVLNQLKEVVDVMWDANFRAVTAER